MTKKRMPLSKDARKYRKQVEELREEMQAMQARVDKTADLERQLMDMDELQRAFDQQEAKLKEAKAKIAHLEKTHERDVKQRTNASLKMKLSNKKSDRYAKMNKDLTTKLLDANRELEKLMKVGRENAVLASEIKSAKYHKEAAARQLEKEKEEAALERQYRLKELFTHEQTLEDLENQKKQTAKEQQRTEEVREQLAKVKKELLDTQIELDQRDHVHNVRVSALHIQRDEIARLKDLIEQMKQDINIQRSEINMWATRYKRMRDGFRVLQARLAKTLREQHSAPTATEKAQLVSPPESSLALLAREMKEVIEADSHIRAKQDTHSFKLKQRELEYGAGVTREGLRASMRAARHSRSAHGRLGMSKSTGALSKRTRPQPKGFRQKHEPQPDCLREELPPHHRHLVKSEKAGRALTDSYMGVGPGTMIKHGDTLTSEGYVIAGDGSSQNFGGASMTDAMDAVMGTVSTTRANFFDTKWLQDDAMVAGIMEAEKREMVLEKKRKRRAARAKMRVGKPRPAGPPSNEAKTSGSLYIGKGLGLRKDVAQTGQAGSVREVLARILSQNPEVARLRKLEQTKLPF